MNSTIVTQMLGVIVQSYAGILAIGVAFFVFLIQQYISRLKDLDKEIMSDMKLYAPQLGPTRLMKFQNEVLEGDHSVQGWLHTFGSNTESYEFQQIMRLVDERKSLNERTMPTIWFQFYFLSSSIVFVYNLSLLFGLSIGLVCSEWHIYLAYILSIIGLVPIVIFAWKIVSLFKKD